jgi:hypothetical protein
MLIDVIRTNLADVSSKGETLSARMRHIFHSTREGTVDRNIQATFDKLISEVETENPALLRVLKPLHLSISISTLLRGDQT